MVDEKTCAAGFPPFQCNHQTIPSGAGLPGCRFTGACQYQRPQVPRGVMTKDQLKARLDAINTGPRYGSFSFIINCKVDLILEILNEGLPEK